MPSLTIYQVDSFANKPFAGNPAGVCILPKAADETWMQQVAREMDLSETSFLYRKPDGAFQLRWFTPTIEVALCGHATLASAHVLWETAILNRSEAAQFDTLSGRLTCQSRSDWIEMDFPAKLETQCEAPEGLTKALTLQPKYIGKNQFDYLVEIESEKELRQIQPDHTALRKLPVRGVIVTSRSASRDYDFVSRFFAPGSGVDEDPVTGSAHCCLAPYWAKKLNKSEMVGYQASARGGVVRVRVQHNRVMLSGQAVTVLRGDLYC
jgi:PhzF family phenazine biosynthesis protein